MWGLCVIFCVCFYVLEIRAERGKEILPLGISSNRHKTLLTKSTWNGTDKDFFVKGQNFSNTSFILQDGFIKNTSTEEEWFHAEISPTELLFIDAPSSSTNGYLTNMSKPNIPISTASTNMLSTIKTVALDYLKVEDQTANPLKVKTKNVTIKISTQLPNATINITEIPTFHPMKTSTDLPVKTVTPNAIQKVSRIFNDYRKRGRQLVSAAMKQVLPSLIRYSSQVKLSGGCSSSIFHIILGLRKLEDWALKLLDASGKVPSGMLHGTVSEMGDYEECLDIMATNTRGRELFQGQYCSVSVQPLLSDHFEYHVYTTNKSLHEMEELLVRMYRIKFRFGFCVPSKCTIDDIRKIAKKVQEEIQLKVTVPWCDVKQPWNWDNVERSVLWFNLFLFSVVVLATLVEVVHRHFEHHGLKNFLSKHHSLSGFLEFTRCFSLYTNVGITLTTKSGNHDLPVVHGIRVFSINWIILGNTFYLLSYNQMGALTKVLDLGKDLAFQLVIQTTFAVDTFFFISGLLVTHRTLRKLGENQDHLNLLKFYIHRYWRLTPAFILISALIIIAPNFGSGPLWHDKLDSSAKVCRKNWWTNLLYISNFLKPEEICVSHGFYLACEMQFFLLSPVFIMTLYRKAIVGKLLLALGIFGSMITVGILTPLFNQMPTLLFSVTEPNIQDEFARLIFFMPYTHFAPYCVGIATGYILFVYRHKKISIHPIVALLGWTVAFTCNLAVVFGVYAWNRGYLPGLVTGALYACISRFVWTLGLSWVVVACMNGYGGTINSLLSWKFYVPLSRLSYLVFLIHPACIIFFFGHYRSTLYYSSCLVFYLFLAYTSVSYLGGFLCSLFYQTPFWSLERFIVTLMYKNSSSTNDDLNRDSSQNVPEDGHRLTMNKKELDLNEAGITSKDSNSSLREFSIQNQAYMEKE